MRKVNEVTVKDRYPLSKISECIDSLPGCEHTDASKETLMTVLPQVQDGKERVVGYGNSILSAARRNYCMTTKDCCRLCCSRNI